MPDSLAKELLRRLGAVLPDSVEVSPEQKALHEELAKREAAKAGPIKRAVAGAVEGMSKLAKGLFSDPNMPRAEFDKTSNWEKAGMLGAALPFGPKGIKGLYSRAERIAESLPNSVHPNKLGTILRNRASQEEVQWRGLDKLMQGAGNKQIPKQNVIKTLQDNPLDVKVVEKGPQRFEVNYGPRGQASKIFTTEREAKEFAKQNSLEVGEPATIRRMDDDSQYSLYTMPGASNYRETLIQLPVKEDPTTGANLDPIFTGHHWDEPNVLVHVRHNERNLPLSKTRIPNASHDTPVFHKGRMLENVQSDWHQRGAHQGYGNDPFTKQVHNDAVYEAYGRANRNFTQKLHEAVDRLGLREKIDARGMTIDDDEIFALVNDYKNWRGRLKDEAGNNLENEWTALYNDLQQARVARDNMQDAMIRASEQSVPNAPFKDSWAELALKQQLMDVADRPDLDWLGIAPSSELRARGEVISPEFQDKQLPNTLEKLLKPFGGKVEKADLGIKQDPAKVFTWDNFIGHHGGIRGYGLGEDVEYLSALPGADRSTLYKQFADQQPNIQAFIARLTPEMKERIKKEGFPLIVALLSAQGLLPKEDN